MKGLKLELVDVAGRRTLPANDLVKLFAKSHRKGQAFRAIVTRKQIWSPFAASSVASPPWLRAIC